jgi:hypothetical protein
VVEVYEEVHADIAPVKVAEKNPKYKKNVQGTTRNERDCLLAAIQEAVWLLVETVTE